MSKWRGARGLNRDEVVWTITANNICAAPAADVAIANPVPEHMRYVGDTAFGPGAIGWPNVPERSAMVRSVRAPGTVEWRRVRIFVVRIVACG